MSKTNGLVWPKLSNYFFPTAVVKLVLLCLKEHLGIMVTIILIVSQSSWLPSFDYKCYFVVTESVC